ncbi:hypothetical protein SeMB42_g04565 [Synchytrium endobioticum]|uniref:Uncharacterized protein n=1 Tax=Synchytrium endobioticum TaxID=286115 RepID=A0A507CXB0_9FUNG|nr:hypothetical protein SeMB42_g04565 [Synchytrium endobioticum]
MPPMASNGTYTSLNELISSIAHGAGAGGGAGVSVSVSTADDNKKRNRDSGKSFVPDQPPHHDDQPETVRVANGLAPARSATVSPSKSSQPSVKPHPHSLPAMTKFSSPEIIRRNNIALEVLTTEQSYLNSLTLIQTVFVEPLLAVMGTDREIVSRKVFDKIIPNTFHVIYNLNKSLLARLEERLQDSAWDPSTGRLGDIFLDTGPYLKIYSLYIQNFNGALSIIDDQISRNQKFANFLKEDSIRQACKGLSIPAYLITPVQRIPRYKLLLQDLLKYTPANHVDRMDLENAYKLVEAVAIFKILAPSRLFLHKGDLQKICRKNHQLRRVYVLSDMIICAIPSLLSDQYHFKRQFDLEFCEVKNIPDSDTIKNCFQLISPGKSYAFYTDTEAQKLQWVGIISRAIKECKSNQKTIVTERDAMSKQKRTLMADYKAPIWIPDDQASSCMQCKEEFSIFRRKHHCRLCGLVVCNPCSSNYVVLPGHEERPARTCDPCFAKVEREGKFQVVYAHESPTLGSGGSSGDEDESFLARAMKLSSWLVSPTAAQQSSHLVHCGLSSDSQRVPPLKTSTEGSTKKCGLCSEAFTMLRWKNVCEKCGRQVCGNCASKSQEYRLCDPCGLGIAPSEVIVEESGWSSKTI